MAETAFVLIVEQDSAQGETLAEGLKRQGHACRVVTDGAEAIDSIRARPPDVIVVNCVAGGKFDGPSILQQAGELAPGSELIRLTEPGDVDAVREQVTAAAARARAARDAQVLQDRMERAYNFEGIIGSSPELAKEIRRIKKLARSKSTVLIIGESGTGKELVAQALHSNSPRAEKPFKVVNCAALAETLLESELFGHVKGAFTGAIADKKGILEAADGGTLFLDEIGDMPQTMQAKLLRTLETGEVVRVGTTEARFVDVRFIAATHRDLWDLVEKSKFREDLYYRLRAQGAIRLPPLRNRREDIPILAQHFLEQANAENGTNVKGISSEAMRRLTNYRWRGNVRELRSVIDQMVIEADGEILDLGDLPDSLAATTDIVPLGPGPSLAGLSMADVEKLHILNTLKLTGGNREKAAKILGIGARTLYRKLKDYGVT